MQHYDFIIVGGGAAGCVLAARLSEMRDCRVLLIEAGEDFAPGSEPEDILSTYPHSYFNRDYAWHGLGGHWLTEGTSPFTEMRQGKVMGGGSSLMGMVALRGTPDDYDAWERCGVAGWSWQDVLPYFKKLETDADHQNPEHGHDGPVSIRRLQRDEWPPLLRALAQHARSAGISAVDDFNGEFADGFGAVPLSMTDHRRASASICYLTSDVRSRSNLDILSSTEVTGLRRDGRRVVGVVVRTKTGDLELSGRQTIISAGALQSPVILMRSGIGPGHHLNQCGIPVVADRAGVGSNLHNHQILHLLAHLQEGAVPGPHARLHTVAMDRYSSGAADCVHSDMCITLINQTAWHALGRTLSSLSSIVLKPYSRGSVRLEPRNPAVSTQIAFDFRADIRDTTRHVDGVRRALTYLLDPGVRRLLHNVAPIMNQAKLRAFNDFNTFNRIKTDALRMLTAAPLMSKIMMSQLTRGGVDAQALLRNGDKLQQFVDQCVTGMAHHAGTCRMGGARDRHAVVDCEGRVHDMEGLRVIDASVMPWIPRGNTFLPTVMIAEKMSDAMVREFRAHRTPSPC